MYDLQKASMFKRISAYLFDVILLSIVAVLCMLALSAVLGYDGYSETVDAAYDKYGEMYGVDLRISTSEYEKLDEEGRFVNSKIIVRDKAEIKEVESYKADYMDVSPKMVVSVATAMIPFIENDDNARALMGSNMQKQAVPLLTNDSPIVGTGMEYKAAVDSGQNSSISSV